MASVPGGGTFLNPLFQVVSFGAGTALGPVLRPVLQDLQNETWTLHPVRPPDALTLAEGVAQGHIDPRIAAAYAKQSGFGDPQFAALIEMASAGPGMAQAFNLWRRLQGSGFGKDSFYRAMKRLGLEAEWIDDLWNVREDILDPAQLAVMIQRTVVENPGILPNQPSTVGSNVPLMPLVPIDALAEAAGSGINADRLAAMARIIGLPASPDLAARMHFRKIITEGAFNQAILEGNTRGEWAPFLLEGFRDIPTSHDFIEAELRGWIDTAARHAGTERHGMVDADSDLLFKITGRPLSFHQVFIGERRGGVYDGPTADIEPAFLKSLRESNIRPEWYHLAWAQRYSYPSAFVLRALTQGGDLTQAEAEEILLFIGWPPTLATKVSTRWAGGASGASDPHVGKAMVQLWGTTHRSYIAGESDDAEATSALVAAGVAAAATGDVLTLWQHERSLIRKQLTPAQIKKAYAKVSKNYATGANWTRDDALAALVERGYSVTEANDFLDIP